MPNERVYLTGQESTADLMARGLPRSTAQEARQRGYYCPQYKNKPCPQHEGSGHFDALQNPYAFILYMLTRGLRRHMAQVTKETFEDWTQTLLLKCWERRHAPHIEKALPYYAAMIDGMIRDWLTRDRKERARLIPLHKG